MELIAFFARKLEEKVRSEESFSPDVRFYGAIISNIILLRTIEASQLDAKAIAMLWTLMICLWGHQLSVIIENISRLGVRKTETK